MPLTGLSSGQLVYPSLKDVAVVMHLHELGPVGGRCGDFLSYQVTSTNISTHVDPSSARMSTYIGTNAEPVRSPLCLLLFFFLMYL